MAYQYTPAGSFDEELLLRLKEVRTSIAVRKSIPAYYIFPDKTLIDMAVKVPTTLEEMEAVYGVGKTKNRQYGEAFLDEIIRYVEENGTAREKQADRPDAPRKLSSGVNDMLISISPVSYDPIIIENFEEIRERLDYYLDFYRNAAYTEENLQQAQADKTNLNRLKKVLGVRKKEIKDICLEPFRSVEVQFKELISMIDAPLARIAEFTEEMEQVRKDEKCAEIKVFFDENAKELGSLANEIFSKAWFYNKKWENRSYKEQQWKREIRDRIGKVTEDILTIKNAAGPHTAAVIAKYVETGSTIEAARYLHAVSSIAEEEKSKPQTPIAPAPVSKPTIPPETTVIIQTGNETSSNKEENSKASNAVQEKITEPTVLPDDNQPKDYLFRIKLNKKQYQLLTIFMELNDIPFDSSLV